jgi:hypothetical protein
VNGGRQVPEEMVERIQSFPGVQEHDYVIFRDITISDTV